jgi:SAM-dependent methyltransferase
MTGSTNRWTESTRGQSGQDYDARFAAMTAAGVDVHGEAAFCADRTPAGGRILDAGCGTGRVAIELARRGFDVVGVDADPSMLARARSIAPQLRWIPADLAGPGGAPGGRFDLVVAAGNVVPFLAPGTERDVVRHLAAALTPDGLLVAGFGLDAAHLPPAAGVVSLADYDDWCAEAGLELRERHATWQAAAYTGGGYAVSVHARA